MYRHTEGASLKTQTHYYTVKDITYSHVSTVHTQTLKNVSFAEKVRANEIKENMKSFSLFISHGVAKGELIEN